MFDVRYHWVTDKQVLYDSLDQVTLVPWRLTSDNHVTALSDKLILSWGNTDSFKEVKTYTSFKIIWR